MSAFTQLLETQAEFKRTYGFYKDPADAVFKGFVE